MNLRQFQRFCAFAASIFFVFAIRGTAFANDDCGAALPVTIGSTVSGTTSNATLDNVGFCGTSNTAPGVWYTVVGDGGTMTASTCNQASYDTKISVFTGSCGSLSCEGGQDDASGCSGFTTEFSWPSTAGVTYNVLVHGYAGSTGQFDLTVTSTGATNPACVDVSLTLTTDSFGSETAFSLTNLDTGEIVFDAAGGSLTSSTTYDFGPSCVSPDSCYSFTITDSFGDGICCVWGQGSYEITFDGTSVPSPSGGAFGSSETVEFCVSAGCTVDADCPGQVCDGATGLCVDCLDDAGPGVDDAGCTSPAGTCIEASGGDNTCQHDPCVVGAALESDCSECVATICEVDSFCCNISWDSICVGEVATVCGQTCGESASSNSSACVDCAETADCDTGDVCNTAINTCVPANDDVCGAEAVGLGDSTGFDLEFTSAEPDEVSPGAGTGASSCNSDDGWCSFETGVQNSLWYSFIAPASGCAVVETVGGDTQLAGWGSSDCADFSTFNEFGGNDDGGAGFNARLELHCLTPGSEVFIQLDGFAGSQVEGTITFDDCGAAPLTVAAGECQTRFVGIAAVGDSNYLVATGSGGEAPYTYTWEPGGLTGGTVTVSPDVPTTYTVTATDANGCTTQDTVFVDVVDVTANCRQNRGGGTAKVELCHVPPGNPANQKELCISEAAVADHLSQHDGDGYGSCDNQCLATNPPPPQCVDVSLTLTTDLFGSETAFSLTNLDTGDIVVDAAGGSLTSSTTYDFGPSCVSPDSCYSFTITDSFGDGICCVWGQGDYEITFDNASIPSPSGGAFGSSETVQFGNCAP